ncbi:MAG: RND family transporter [Deltaproteobacteria bacterium]|nr:RND family transporter [Deltaproteobacteria bacterium]
MHRLSDLILRAPKTVAALVTLLTVVGGVLAGYVKFDFNMENMLPDRHPNRDVYEDYKATFGQDDAFYVIGIRTGNVFTHAMLRDLQQLTLRIEAREEVDEVLSLTNVMFPRADAEGVTIEPFVTQAPTDPAALAALRAEAMANPILPENLISRDGSTTALMVKLKPEFNHHDYRVAFEKELWTIIDDYRAEDREIHMGGTPVLRSAYIKLAQENIQRFVPLSALVLVIVLFLTFRNVSGILLPLGTVGAAMILSVGFMTVVDIPLNLLTNVLPSVVLVVGVSDSIHLLEKYKEEYLKDFDQHRAMADTIRKIAIACFFTSATTAVGFASLITSSNKMIRQFGTVAAVGVMMAYVVTILFVPAVLILIKPPKVERAQALEDGLLARALYSKTTIVTNHAKPIALMTVLVLIAAGVGMSRIQNQYYMMEDVPPGEPITKAYHFLDEHLGSVIPMAVMVESKSGRPMTDPAILADLEKIQHRLREFDTVGKVTSLVDFVEEMNRLLHDGDKAYLKIPETREAVAQYLLLYSMGEEDPTADYLTFDQSRTQISARTVDMGQITYKQLIAEMEDFMAKEIDPDLHAVVTGAGPMVVVLCDRLVSDMITSLGLAFAIIFVLIVVEFKSWRLAMVSMVPNMIPLLVMAGFMGFTGVALNPSTAVSFAVAFGIAVDDTIHFLVRYRRELPLDNDYGKAVFRTVKGTGRAIVLTSVVLALGFAVLMTSNFKANATFGMLSALLMAVALLADMVVLPALLILIKPKMSDPYTAA